MPFEIGLHVLLALLCAVHVVRSGQPMYWLFILFAFPLLGSLVYVFAVYLPESRVRHGALRVVGSATRALDPDRAVRDARIAVDEIPTAQNQMRLAAALFAAGSSEEAATRYERCLTGPFAADLDIRLGAARALVACGRFAQALVHLQFIRGENPDFRAETIALLVAHCYVGLSRPAEAGAEFAAAVERFGTFEARADYAVWARQNGETETADRLDAEVAAIVKRWNAHARALNVDALRRWQAATSRAR